MKTILVVDDDEIILSLIPRFLDNIPIGLKVLTAGNGAEAIDVLTSTKVDIVLTDLNMPVMDGFVLLAYILDKHPEIKTIAMTGLQREDLHEKLSVLGISYCIEKPFSFKDINENIIQILGNDTKRPETVNSMQKDNELNPASVRQVSQ